MKKLFLTLLLALSVSLGFNGLALAQSPTQSAKTEVCNGISGTTGGSCDTGSADINNIIKAILQILSYIAGIAAVIMIVIGGLKYITSGGDSSSIASAKTTLIYALVGVVIVTLAQGVVFFVLGSTG